jgi:hypothetical protein
VEGEDLGVLQTAELLEVEGHLGHNVGVVALTLSVFVVVSLNILRMSVVKYLNFLGVLGI